MLINGTNGVITFAGAVTINPPPCKPNPPVMGNLSFNVNNTGNTTSANITITPQYDGGYGVNRYTDDLSSE